MPSMRQPLRVDAHEFVDQHETGAHQHSRHQLTYTRSGVLSVDVASTRWVVPPLRAVWIPANVTHSIRAHGTTSARLVFLDTPPGVAFPTEVTVVEASPLLREIIEELRADLLGDEDARPHLEALVLIHLQKRASQRSASVRPLRMSQLTDPRLAIIEATLRRSPSDRRTLKQWGQLCGSSERTLTRLFMSSAGTTFSYWRSQIRMQHAVIQLAGGESVTATAHECGYRSTSAFIEAFSGVFGTTPGSYIQPETPN